MRASGRFSAVVASAARCSAAGPPRNEVPTSRGTRSAPRHPGPRSPLERSARRAPHQLEPGPARISAAPCAGIPPRRVGIARATTLVSWPMSRNWPASPSSSPAPQCPPRRSWPPPRVEAGGGRRRRHPGRRAGRGRRRGGRPALRPVAPGSGRGRLPLIPGPAPGRVVGDPPSSRCVVPALRRERSAGYCSPAAVFGKPV